MLIHIIPHTPVANTPFLTYRTTSAVQVGQLVLITVRGRSIPGMVAKINVTADTAANILPVKKVGTGIVPASFVATIIDLADYYAVTPAAIWSQLNAAVNRPYLDAPPVTAQVEQECWVTPNSDSPLGTALGKYATTVPGEAQRRRAQWHQAATGQALRVVGGLNALFLPYRNLKKIVLDTPTASPYRSDRSPGCTAAVVAALVAKHTGATLVIRSPLPLEIWQKLLPLPEKVICQQPKYHEISAQPLGARGYVNDDLIGSIKTQLTNKKRVLIYYNHLPKITGQTSRVEQLALDLEKRLGCAVEVSNKTQPDPTAPVVIATSHALYSRLTWDYAVILFTEGLVSPNQPRSPLQALETIAMLASRSPLLAQFREAENSLVRAVVAQLHPEAIEQIPLFTKRIISFRFPANLTDKMVDYQALIRKQWPNLLEENNCCYAITEQSLSRAEKSLLLDRPKLVKIKTDDNSLTS